MLLLVVVVVVLVLFNRSYSVEATCRIVLTMHLITLLAFLLEEGLSQDFVRFFFFFPFGHLRPSPTPTPTPTPSPSQLLVFFFLLTCLLLTILNTVRSIVEANYIFLVLLTSLHAFIVMVMVMVTTWEDGWNRIEWGNRWRGAWLVGMREVRYWNGTVQKEKAPLLLCLLRYYTDHCTHTLFGRGYCDTVLWCMLKADSWYLDKDGTVGYGIR